MDGEIGYVMAFLELAIELRHQGQWPVTPLRERICECGRAFAVIAGGVLDQDGIRCVPCGLS